MNSLIQERVEHYYGILDTYFGASIVRPTIGTSLKGHCAGKAYTNKNLIKLNGYLLETETDEMLNDTLPHEIAHIIARKAYGKVSRSHGWEWQTIMGILGVKPTRCHTMKTQPARIIERPHAYECSCKIHNLTNRLHNKILVGSRRVCMKCKSLIVEVNLTEVEF
jgi:SprT protein